MCVCVNIYIYIYIYIYMCVCVCVLLFCFKITSIFGHPLQSSITSLSHFGHRNDKIQKYVWTVADTPIFAAWVCLID